MRTVRVVLEITYNEKIHDHPETWDWFSLLEMDGEPDEITRAEEPEVEWFRLGEFADGGELSYDTHPYVA